MTRRRRSRSHLGGLLLASLTAAAAPGAGATRPVAHVKELTGVVEILGDEPWQPARLEHPLSLAHEVRTGKSSRARIDFVDGVEGGAATRIELSEDTQVSMEQFELSQRHPPKRTGFVGLIKGMIRAVTKGWSGGSVFSARTGSVVCGVRGSDVLVTRAEGRSGLIMLGGDVFKFHWEDGQRAAEIAALLASSPRTEGLVSNSHVLVHGLEVTPLGPGYAATVTDTPAGPVLQEIVLPGEVLSAIRANLDDLGRDPTNLEALSKKLAGLVALAQEATLEAPPRRVKLTSLEVRADIAGRAVYRAELDEALEQGTAAAGGNPLRAFFDRAAQDLRALEEALDAAREALAGPGTPEEKAATVRALMARIQELRAVIGQISELKRLTDTSGR